MKTTTFFIYRKASKEKNLLGIYKVLNLYQT